jgi:hypothetical protein
LLPAIRHFAAEVRAREYKLDYREWDFLMRHEEMLAAQPRTYLQVKNFAILTKEEKKQIRKQAEELRASPDFSKKVWQKAVLFGINIFATRCLDQLGDGFRL